MTGDAIGQAILALVVGFACAFWGPDVIRRIRGGRR